MIVFDTSSRLSCAHEKMEKHDSQVFLVFGNPSHGLHKATSDLFHIRDNLDTIDASQVASRKLKKNGIESTLYTISVSSSLPNLYTTQVWKDQVVSTVLENLNQDNANPLINIFIVGSLTDNRFVGENSYFSQLAYATKEIISKLEGKKRIFLLLTDADHPTVVKVLTEKVATYKNELANILGADFTTLLTCLFRAECEWECLRGWKIEADVADHQSESIKWANSSFKNLRAPCCSNTAISFLEGLLDDAKESIKRIFLVTSSKNSLAAGAVAAFALLVWSILISDSNKNQRRNSKNSNMHLYTPYSREMNINEQMDPTINEMAILNTCSADIYPTTPMNPFYKFLNPSNGLGNSLKNNFKPIEPNKSITSNYRNDDNNLKPPTRNPLPPNTDSLRSNSNPNYNWLAHHIQKLLANNKQHLLNSNQPPPNNNQPPLKNNQPPPKNNLPPPKNNQPPSKNNQLPPNKNQYPPNNYQPSPNRKEPPPNSNQPPPNNNKPPPNSSQPPPNSSQSPPNSNQPPSNTNQPPPNSNQALPNRNQLPPNRRQPPKNSNQPPPNANSPSPNTNQSMYDTSPPQTNPNLLPRTQTAARRQNVKTPHKNTNNPIKNSKTSSYQDKSPPVQVKETSNGYKSAKTDSRSNSKRRTKTTQKVPKNQPKERKKQNKEGNLKVNRSHESSTDKSRNSFESKTRAKPSRKNNAEK